MKFRPKTFEVFGDSAVILQSNDFLLSEVMPAGEFKVFKKSGVSGKYHTGRIARSKSGRLRIILTGPIVKRDSPRDPNWRLRSRAFDKGLNGKIYSLRNYIEARIGDSLRIVISGIMPRKAQYKGTSVELKASVDKIRIWHLRASGERSHSIYWHWNAPEYPTFEYTRDDFTLSKTGRTKTVRIPGVVESSYEQFANNRNWSYTPISLCGNSVLIGRDPFSDKRSKPFCLWFPGSRIPDGRERRSIQSVLLLMTGEMAFPMSHVQINEQGHPLYQEFYDSLHGETRLIKIRGRYPAVMNDYRKTGKQKPDAYEEWLGKLISKYHEISKSKKMQLDEIVHLLFSSQGLSLDTRHLPLARAMDLFNAGAVDLGLVVRRAHVDKKDFRAFLRKAKRLMVQIKDLPGWQRIADKMANLNSTSQSQAIREIPSILGVGVGVVERGIVDGRNAAVHASAWDRDDDTLMMGYEAALAFLQRLVLALIGHRGATVDHTARGKQFRSLVAIGDPLGGGEPVKLQLPKTRLLTPYRRHRHFYR